MKLTLYQVSSVGTVITLRGIYSDCGKQPEGVRMSHMKKEVLDGCWLSSEGGTLPITLSGEALAVVLEPVVVPDRREELRVRRNSRISVE